MKLFEGLTKAVVAVVLVPGAVVADVFTLPASAERSDPPFGRTAGLFRMISRNVRESLE